MLAALALMLLACGGRAEAVERCYARKPTISKGIYGCATSIDDEQPSTLAVFEKCQVHIFHRRPRFPRDDLVTPYARTETDHIGFYQLTLDPGHYWICQGTLDCYELDVAEGPPSPHDYDWSRQLGFAPAPERMTQPE